jgi:hypothetical protein
MCRGETCAKEKILADDEMIEFGDEEEEEEEEEEEDNDEEEIPEFDDAAHALWVMRKTFEMLDDGLSIASEPLPVVLDTVFPDRGMFRYWKYDLDRGYESS